MSDRSAPYSNSQPSQQLINMGWKERDFVKKKERKSLCKPKNHSPSFSRSLFTCQAVTPFEHTLNVFFGVVWHWNDTTYARGKWRPPSPCPDPRVLVTPVGRCQLIAVRILWLCSIQAYFHGWYYESFLRKFFICVSFDDLDNCRLSFVFKLIIMFVKQTICFHF
jgi:hypothetical protein